MSAPSVQAEMASVLDDFDLAAEKKNFTKMAQIIHSLVKYGNEDIADSLQARFDDLWEEEKWLIEEQTLV